MNETSLRNSVLLRVSAIGARLFRNNTGQAWIGRSERISKACTVRVFPGDVVIREARPLHAGLVKGGSDLIGWTPVRIDENDIGRTIAVFTALELKTGRLQATPEQANFIEKIGEAGGIAGIVRSPDDALAVMAKWSNPES
jgi:hypothetical protein